MFEADLYNYIKTNFKISGVTIVFGFASVPETTVTPYVIQFSLDSDGTRQVLCHDDDFTDGVAFIQWNIYNKSSTSAFTIRREFEQFLNSIRYFEQSGNKYMLQLNHSSSPSAQQDSTGKWVEVVARDITYQTLKG